MVRVTHILAPYQSGDKPTLKGTAFGQRACPKGLASRHTHGRHGFATHD